MLHRVLIANRAEIAARIIRTAERRGTETVAVFSDVDARLPYVSAATEAVHLPGSAADTTYLRADLLVAAAVDTGCDAVHPGYGFLSEQAAFARACEAAGLTFIGPPATVIEQMGSKIEAKRLMGAAGVPVLEGATVAHGTDDDRLAALADGVGYPLLVKAAFGGGGRGMRVVEARDEVVEAVGAASREAAAAFGDGAVFLERLVVAPRHVEVQVLADAHGTVVHLFERECSVQRRHQKVVEETPSPGIGESTRTAICEAAVTAARTIGYVNAGTVEFVVDRDEQFSFLEVNTRLQVEHPVTELVLGIDLVEAQFAIAEGQPLPEELTRAVPRGHAIEVRLYAEDALADDLPASGRLRRFDIPDGPGVRVDAGYASGSVVSTSYDAMLAKVIGWAPTRDAAARRLSGALRGARLHGVTTNRDVLVGILESAEFLAGSTDTAFLERNPPAAIAAAARDKDAVQGCVVAALWQRAMASVGSPQPAGIPAGWRSVGPSDQPRSYELFGDRHVVSVIRRPDALSVILDGTEVIVNDIVATPTTLTARLDGRRVSCEVSLDDAVIDLDGTLGALTLIEVPRLAPPVADELPGSLHAPLPGGVRRVTVSEGDVVSAGDVLVVLEAMKMEHAIRAPLDGVVAASVLVADGDQVQGGDVLVVVATGSVE